MNNLSNTQLLNISEAAEYLGTTHNWINFLKDNHLVIPIYLPQYKKPRFTKKSLDTFIARLEDFNSNDDADELLQKAFLKAAEIRNEKFEKLKNAI